MKNTYVNSASLLEEEIEKLEEQKEEKHHPVLLLIEDHADFRTFTKSILQNYYEIKEASNGESGWVKALELIPDLIIADL